MACALVRMLLLTVLTICAPGLSALPSAAQGQEEIATYTNKRFGFTLSYPTARFQPKEPLSEEGRQWVSHDGNARLLASALPNDEAMDLKAYRDFVLKESYAGAALDYAPISDTWFVLSGSRDGM